MQAYAETLQDRLIIWDLYKTKIRSEIMSKKKNSEPKERYRAEWLGQPLTAEEARAKGKAGGIKSGQVRKEKKR